MLKTGRTTALNSGSHVIIGIRVESQKLPLLQPRRARIDHAGYRQLATSGNDNDHEQRNEAYQHGRKIIEINQRGRKDASGPATAPTRRPMPSVVAITNIALRQERVQ